MRKVKNIPGVYIESITSTGINRKGEHDGITGHYTSDIAREYAVTLDFFDIEYLTYLDGRAPEEDDFYIDDDGIQVVPVVVGSQLRDEFKIGEIIVSKSMYDLDKCRDPIRRVTNMSKASKGIVVGVLGRSNAVTTSDGAHFYHLSDSIIKTIKDPSPDSYPELKSSDDAYVYVSYEKLYDMINMKVFINRTNEEQAAKEIRQALQDTEIDVIYSFSKCDGYAKITASLEKGRTEVYLHVALCVGALCVFGLGVLIVMLNIANARDYAVHRLVGATRHDIALMTTVQVFILLMASDVLIHYPYLLSKTGLFLNGDSMLYIFSGERKIYIVIVALNLATLLLTYIISFVFASKTDVVTKIREKE